MSGLLMKYFVLKPEGNGSHSRASRAAMLVYANIISHVDSQLATDLRTWVADEERKIKPNHIERGKNLKQFNHWLAALREIAYSKDLKDPEGNKYPKTRLKLFYSRNMFIKYFHNGWSPETAFQDTLGTIHVLI